VTLAEGRSIGVADLPLGRAQSPTPEIEHFDALRTQLVGLLDLHRGNIAAVARALDKDRMQIHRWMRRFALDLETFRR
jgi:transcriptional regulator of acetoin/glycerol metabolism